MIKNTKEGIMQLEEALNKNQEKTNKKHLITIKQFKY